MKRLFLPVLMVGCIPSLGFGADGLPPTITKARLAKDGKAVELVKMVTAQEEKIVEKKVPQQITVTEGGKDSTKTIYKEVQEKYFVTFSKPVTESLSLEGLELRTAAGGHHKMEEIGGLLGSELAPVIVLHREWSMVDGQWAARIEGFDRSFLNLFKPDALVLILPAPAMRTGVMPAASGVIAPATTAPATVPPTPIP